MAQWIMLLLFICLGYIKGEFFTSIGMDNLKQNSKIMKVIFITMSFYEWEYIPPSSCFHSFKPNWATWAVVCMSLEIAHFTPL